MKLFSIAIKQEGENFYAQAPDLPHIHVIGHNITDTIDKMRGVLIEYLQQLADTHQPLPTPENINVHLTDPKFAGQTWAIISLNSMLFNNQQKSLCLPLSRELLTHLQARVGYKEDNIKQFIITAITNELERSNTNT